MKQKTSTLSKKITGYSTMAASLLAISNIANGQIVYTDVTPDFVGTGNGASYDLDLNNDGTTDFQVNISSNGADVKLLINASDNNAIAGTSSDPYKYPSLLQANDIIGDALTWVEGNYQTMATSGYFGNPYGDWFGAVDGYMGLRIKVGNDDHYGWARFDVSEDGKTFTVKDYAYESTEDAPIAAGDAGSIGITPVNAIGYKVFAANQSIHLQLKNNLSGDVTITNLLGQRIKLVEINSNAMQINMSDQTPGIYMVTVRQNGEVFTQKVVI
ncbi:MAG: T9SS type A sorting domain-containing protein [Chitinophagales bacterium]